MTIGVTRQTTSLAKGPVNRPVNIDVRELLKNKGFNRDKCSLITSLLVRINTLKTNLTSQGPSKDNYDIVAEAFKRKTTIELTRQEVVKIRAYILAYNNMIIKYRNGNLKNAAGLNMKPWYSDLLPTEIKPVKDNVVLKVGIYNGGKLWGAIPLTIDKEIINEGLFGTLHKLINLKDKRIVKFIWDYYNNSIHDPLLPNANPEMISISNHDEDLSGEVYSKGSIPITKTDLLNLISNDIAL